MRQLLLQITVWEVKERETGRPCTIRGPGNELEKFVLRETGFFICYQNIDAKQ